MSLKLVSDQNNVAPFPQERHLAPRVKMVREMAPPPALVASILEESALSLPGVPDAFHSQTQSRPDCSRAGSDVRERCCSLRELQHALLTPSARRADVAVLC